MQFLLPGGKAFDRSSKTGEPPVHGKERLDGGGLGGGRWLGSGRETSGLLSGGRRSGLGHGKGAYMPMPRPRERPSHSWRS